MYKSFSKFNVFLLLFFVFVSCTKPKGTDPDPEPDPEIIIPSNLNLNISIVGQDANHPNGDGSGTINCSITATDAVKYGYRFGDGNEIESLDGNLQYTYTQEGTKDYTIYAVAYSKTGHSAITSKSISLYVTGELNLIWSDEFNTDGAPSSAKWTYDNGNGQSGWGNNELEFYTDRSENVIQQNGNLVITAKKEPYQGFNYTSARLKTQGKFSFTYGKVEVRAKLPAGTGVWPAIWMLGDNINTVGWPACGEVDIMEYVGYQPNVVHSAIHTTSSSGGTVNNHSYDLASAEEEYHVYSAVWSDKSIKFYVDDILHYTYTPSVYDDAHWPFYENQFLILNLAIGGNWGGTQGVDDSIFPQVFSIDYVRVYQ
jgi:beta-glucanase (GH16 family)